MSKRAHVWGFVLVREAQARRDPDDDHRAAVNGGG